MTVSAARMARFKSEMEEEAVRGGKDFIRFPYFTPPQNQTLRIRVLPGMDINDPEKEFYAKVYQHFNVSPSKKIPVTCPKTKVSGSDCPVCQRVQALFKAATPQDVKEAKYIKSRVKYFMGVIPQEGENAGKIMIWGAPKQVKDAIINLMNLPDYGDPTDLKTGRDLYITKTGEQLDTDYALLPVPTASAMSESEDELAALVAALPPLFYLRNSASLDNIRKYMSGETDNIMQGFALAPTDGKAPETAAAEEGVFTTAEAPAGVTPVATVIEAHKPALPTGVIQHGTGTMETSTGTPGQPVTVNNPVVGTHFTVASPGPTTVVASNPVVPVAAPKKFDLGAIQAQINKINAKK